MANKAKFTGRFAKKSWHQRRDLRFVLVVTALVGLYFGYGFATGPSRIDPVLQTVLAGNPARVNIVVISKFPPEEFHIGVYQWLGSMRGTEGNATLLYRVRPRDVRTLSRYYWIERITLAPDPQKARRR
jgi:hypothetical protein